MKLSNANRKVLKRLGFPDVCTNGHRLDFIVEDGYIHAPCVKCLTRSTLPINIEKFWELKNKLIERDRAMKEIKLNETY